MSIILNVQISSPLTDEDKELLAGVAAMTFAIANQQLGLQPDQEEEEEEPQPCGSVDPNGSGSCISPVGHSGRHKYRPLSFHAEMNN